MSNNDVQNKGNEFKGLAGGKNYKRFAKVLGMNEQFYRKGIGNVYLDQNMKALDLGCGPGALSFALAENAHNDSEIIGIDISTDQLRYADSNKHKYNCKLEFLNCSMDELAFPANSFDYVISSMALHETPPKVRRASIKEVSRVLKPSGLFIYVDWSKPKFGLWGLVWLPMVSFGSKNQDNWNNNYVQICKTNNLIQIEDGYINSIARRQVFAKGINSK